MRGSRRGWPGGQVQAAGLAKTKPEIAGQQRRDPSGGFSFLFLHRQPYSGVSGLLSLAPTWPPCDNSELNLWVGEADDLYQTLDLLA